MSKTDLTIEEMFAVPVSIVNKVAFIILERDEAMTSLAAADRLAEAAAVWLLDKEVLVLQKALEAYRKLREAQEAVNNAHL